MQEKYNISTINSFEEDEKRSCNIAPFIVVQMTSW
jgi:hypothetical protein